MDDQEMPSSPRKKLKTESTPFDGPTMSPSATPTTKEVAESAHPLQDPELTGLVEPRTTYVQPDVIDTNSAAPVHFNIHDMQLHKEEDVGITEFVSPELPGFTGILKKRFVICGAVLSMDLMVPLQVHRFPCQ